MKDANFLMGVGRLMTVAVAASLDIRAARRLIAATAIIASFEAREARRLKPPGVVGGGTSGTVTPGMVSDTGTCVGGEGVGIASRRKPVRRSSCGRVPVGTLGSGAFQSKCPI